MRWVALGLSDCATSRLTGIPRGTIRDWRAGKGRAGHERSDCPRCHEAFLPSVPYAQLLGLYLGDGCISRAPRDVYKLRISLDQKYPGIITECKSAMAGVRTVGLMRVGDVQREGCVEVYAYWKHWPCLFPQHGPGVKHRRDIRLEPWQERILEKHPDRLLRGLIHSDGYRGDNKVKVKDKTYVYPRYQFSNVSSQIRDIFCRACDRHGVRWRQMNQTNIAVSRREDVAKLDEIIGPKY